MITLFLSFLTSTTLAVVSLRSFYPIPYGAHGKLSSTGRANLALSANDNATVGIGNFPAGTDPSPNALLEVYSTNQGVLFPRLTTAQRDNIPQTAANDRLVIFNLNVTRFEEFDYDPDVPANSQWVTWGSAEDSFDWYWQEISMGSPHIRNTNSGGIRIGYLNNSAITAKLDVGSRDFLAICSNAYCAASSPPPPSAVTVPESTSGIRFLWAPTKAALRIGSISGSVPAAYDNETNIGMGSFGFGQDIVASGDDSMVLNDGRATSTGSIAINNGTAAGTKAVAISSATANGSPSYAVGTGVTANAANSFIIGNAIDANGTTINVSNDTADSLMFFAGILPNPYAETTPTMTVTQTNVGIFTSAPDPTYTLHVLADIAIAHNGGQAPNTPVTSTANWKNKDKNNPPVQACPSDIRLKDHIRPIHAPLEKICQLSPVRFQWNETSKSMGHEPGKNDIGLVAQEVEKIFPELVSGEDYKAVNYEKIGPVLIEALRALYAENQYLESELEGLEKLAERRHV